MMKRIHKSFGINEISIAALPTTKFYRFGVDISMVIDYNDIQDVSAILAQYKLRPAFVKGKLLESRAAISGSLTQLSVEDFLPEEINNIVEDDEEEESCQYSEDPILIRDPDRESIEICSNNSLVIPLELETNNQMNVINISRSSLQKLRHSIQNIIEKSKPESKGEYLSKKSAPELIAIAESPNHFRTLSLRSLENVFTETPRTLEVLAPCASASKSN